jgi:hypothetical protein
VKSVVLENKIMTNSNLIVVKYEEEEYFENFMVKGCFG